MSPASVRAGVLQPCDILLDLAFQVIFDLHRVEVCGKIEHLVLAQVPDFDGVM